MILIHAYYFQVQKWIINLADNYCLDVGARNQVIFSQCKPNNRNQMWEFGILNRTAFHL